MKTFAITLAADLRAYATLTVEAADEHEATNIADAIVTDLDWGKWTHPALAGVTFSPEYDTLTNFEALSVDVVPEG